MLAPWNCLRVLHPELRWVKGKVTSIYTYKYNWKTFIVASWSSELKHLSLLDIIATYVPNISRMCQVILVFLNDTVKEIISETFDQAHVVTLGNGGLRWQWSIDILFLIKYSCPAHFNTVAIAIVVTVSAQTIWLSIRFASLGLQSNKLSFFYRFTGKHFTDEHSQMTSRPYCFDILVWMLVVYNCWWGILLFCCCCCCLFWFPAAEAVLRGSNNKVLGVVLHCTIWPSLK